MSDRSDDDIRERVRARMERDFAAPGELPDDARRMAWAETRLRETLEREMGPPAGEAGAAPSRQAAPRAASGLDEVIRAIVGASWKPAIAIVVLVVGTWTYGVMLEKREGATPRMRGTFVPPGAADRS